jgi:hypothetical protein
MVGKPNFPHDVEAREGMRGSSKGTPGLTPLDEEREASLADEGGASGAAVESQDLETLRRLASETPIPHLPEDAPARPGWPRWAAVAAALAVVAAAGFLIARR